VYFGRTIAYGNGMYPYALIGNCQTSALTGLDGTLDQIDATKFAASHSAY